MPCSGPARDPTAKAASAASAHWRACAGGPLRISHQLAAEALVIGDRRFGESAGFELALAKQYGDLGDRTQKWIGHDDIPRAGIRSQDITPSGRNRAFAAALFRVRLKLS
jgi:hypothetical protein